MDTISSNDQMAVANSPKAAFHHQRQTRLSIL